MKTQQIFVFAGDSYIERTTAANKAINWIRHIKGAAGGLCRRLETRKLQ